MAEHWERKFLDVKTCYVVQSRIYCENSLKQNPVTPTKPMLLNVRNAVGLHAGPDHMVPLDLEARKRFRQPQFFSLEISGPKPQSGGKYSLYRAVRAPRTQPHQPHGWSGPDTLNAIRGKFSCNFFSRRTQANYIRIIRSFVVRSSTNLNWSSCNNRICFEFIQNTDTNKKKESIREGQAATAASLFPELHFKAGITYKYSNNENV